MRQHSAIDHSASGMSRQRHNVGRRVIAGNDGKIRTQEMWEDEYGNAYTRTLPLEESHQRGERFSI
jgi:hypothetical protein